MADHEEIPEYAAPRGVTRGTRRSFSRDQKRGPSYGNEIVSSDPPGLHNQTPPAGIVRAMADWPAYCFKFRQRAESGSAER
jgi:hypothetical protein